MTDRYSEQAARVTGPIAAADATARTGTQRIAITASNQQVTLPTTGKAKGASTTISKRFIRILAVGQNCQWAWGAGSAPTIVYNQVAVVGTGHASAGGTLVDSVPEQMIVPNEATHFAFIGQSATGFLEFYVSDQPVP
jgi:predicted lipoprotein